ncbi:MAG TPA: hypothetical protein VK027_08435 [Chitinophagaceae bacterium]|nr:hypothetical protein [Chitinophagaceae bacterium]
MKQIRFAASLLAASSMLFMYSCKKDKSPEPEPEPPAYVGVWDAEKAEIIISLQGNEFQREEPTFESGEYVLNIREDGTLTMENNSENEADAPEIIEYAVINDHTISFPFNAGVEGVDVAGEATFTVQEGENKNATMHFEDQIQFQGMPLDIDATFYFLKK